MKGDCIASGGVLWHSSLRRASHGMETTRSSVRDGAEREGSGAGPATPRPAYRPAAPARPLRRENARSRTLGAARGSNSRDPAAPVGKTPLRGALNPSSGVTGRTRLHPSLPARLPGPRARYGRGAPCLPPGTAEAAPQRDEWMESPQEATNRMRGPRGSTNGRPFCAHYRRCF